MKKIIFLFSIAVGFATITMAQSNGILTLKKGQKYVVENKISTTSSTQMQGQSMDTKADIVSVYNIEVKNKTDNSFNLTNTITNIKMTMSMMGNNINFDSDSTNDMNGQIGSSLKDYINQPKDVEIDKSGNVITKESADTSESALAKQLGFDASGYGAQAAFLALPQNSKVGSTWSDKSDRDSISKSTNYVIKDISGGIATVSFSGTASTNKTIEQQGMEIGTKTTDKFSGEEKVDTKTGVVQTNTSIAEASGTVTAMGQDFPTTTKITSTTSVKTL